jgi:hypothetical protein
MDGQTKAKCKQHVDNMAVKAALSLKSYQLEISLSILLFQDTLKEIPFLFVPDELHRPLPGV